MAGKITSTKGWQWRQPTQVRDLREPLIARELDEMYAQWVASLVPLRTRSETITVRRTSSPSSLASDGLEVRRTNREVDSERVQSSEAFTFDSAGQIKVDDRDAIGVRVSHKNRPDVLLFFDKNSGLLLKSERRMKDPLTDEEFTVESIYRDHKLFEGVLWPTKRIDRLDGKDQEDNAGVFELNDYRPHEKLDASIFARP